MILGMRDGKHESLARGPGRSTLRLSSHATGSIAVYGGQMFEVVVPMIPVREVGMP
jgi:hypothetical protein